MSRAARDAPRDGVHIDAVFLRAVLHNFPNGSVNVFDSDLRYLFAEGRGLAAIGISSEQLVGKTLTELFPTEAAAYAAAHYRRVLGGEDIEFELAFRGHHYVINASPLLDASGATLIVAVARDVTERKRLEQLRDQFLASVAHDLKTPLSIIKGVADLQLRRIDSRLANVTTTSKHAFERIVASVSDMVEQINTLLDTARLEAGQALAMELTPVDLVTIVKDQVSRHTAMSQGHQLKVHTDAGRVIGNWDRRRLDLLFANLISNAIKYSPAGGAIDIAVGREDDPTGSWGVVTVTDQGIGIPEGELDYVFRRFYRASNAVSGFEGTGVGLAGVRQIAERHGGTVSIASQVGVGTTVTVRLPLDA